MISTNNRKWGVEFAFMGLLLLAVLAALFHGAFPANHTLFSNDGPLGRLASQSRQFPDRFTGSWSDLNGIGFSGGASPPGISMGLQYLLKPVWFSKVYALMSLLILGLGAWCFFAQSKLTPVACILGGLAAALNSSFFSVSCWGVAAQSIAPGLTFFALAALMDTTSRLRWWRVVLAGAAVGMTVVEASDVGAIYSIYVAIFIMYQAWLSPGTPVRRALTGLARLTIVVLCAGFLAAQAISSLLGTSIENVVGTDQDAQTKESRWDWATQWSLPLRETSGFVIPGLFGYRLDSPNGGNYWGDIGQDPSVTRYLQNGHQGPAPHGFMRYSGGGFYAGVLVVMVAIWSLFQTLPRKDAVYDPRQRRWLWFWLVLGFTALLLAFGRFAPFYQWLYALPYFSTVRNPIKFTYLVSMALLVLFAYGLDGLCRRYMPVAGPGAAPRWAGFKAGLAKASAFEKNWLWAGVIILGLTLLGWIQYSSQQPALANYLHLMQFKQSAVDSIANFSIRQVGWFVLFLILSLGLFAGIFTGAFAGPRARWAGVVIGLVLVADLAQANLPWIVFWDYQYKYSSNPIIEKLKDQPYEHRVTILPGSPQQNLPNLSRLYRLEWLQQQFPYYNIQTLDIVDMPRKPKDYAAYIAAPNQVTNSTPKQSYLTVWQLTNSRYILGLAEDLAPWNQLIPQPDQQLRIVQRFDVVPKPGVTNIEELDNFTANLDDNGPFALFEYTGALPRVKLYSNWEVQTNDPVALKELFNPDFDPHQKVVVAGGVPEVAPAATPAAAGKVDFVSYAPKDIVLKSDAPSPTVLLLNDHYDHNWKVSVDGNPGTLLRCNFIMRGVYLTAGAHNVEFRYQPPFPLLTESLTAIGLGLLVLLVVLIAGSLPAKKT